MLRVLPALVAVLCALAVPARAEQARLVSSDERGVTLRVDVPAYSLSAPDAEGRVEVTAPGMRVAAMPGRPMLPWAQAMVALPPGATATVRVVGGDAEEVREGVRLRVAPNPVFREDSRLGPQPGFEPARPIADGAWPREEVVVGEPLTWRRQRLVYVGVRPFRYDEASGRLWVRRSVVVRVEFSGGSPAAGEAAGDSHFEPVLRNTILNYTQAARWREPREAGGGLFDRVRRLGAAAISAFDESEPEVRVRIDTTGVYQVFFQDLEPHGYPAGVPVSEVSVHRHEFVDGTAPPDPSYVTIELPVEVDDFNGNGVFDTDDRLVMPVRSWADRALPTIPQRAWGTAEVVYVTRVAGRAGLRLSQRSGWRGAAGLTPLESYPWTQRWERNFVYNPYPQDTTTDQFQWNELFTYYTRPDTIRFETNHLDTSRAGQFTLMLQGSRPNAHWVWARVRNGAGVYTSVGDSMFWSGKGAFQRVTAPLAGSTFSEGNTNTLGLWGRTNNLVTPPNLFEVVNARLNWFEVTYWRRFRPLRSHLVANSGDAAGLFQVHAGPFSWSDVRVYDWTSPENPVRLTVDPGRIVAEPGGWGVDFQDSTATGQRRSYVVCSEARAVPPANLSAVTRRTLSGRPTAQYLVIVPEALVPAVAPLVTLHQSQGLEVVVAPLEAIQDEFNGGRRSAWAVRRYVRHAYQRQGADFAILVGDGSEDPQDFLRRASLDVVPVQKVFGPVGNGSELEIVPSDPWYAIGLDVENPAGRAELLDVFLGRLPVSTIQQATDAIAKLVAYENLAGDQSWRRRMLLVPDDAYSTGVFGAEGTTTYCWKSMETRFRTLNESVRDEILVDAGLALSEPEILDLGYYLRNEQPVRPPAPFDTCRADVNDTAVRARATFTPDLLTRLNQGRLWWNYQGHANAYQLAHEEIWLSAGRGTGGDVNQLTNSTRPFLFSAFSCHANAFATVKERAEDGPSLGEEMVVAAARGAIGSWASVGFELIPFSSTDHLNVHLAAAMFSNPPHDPRLGDRGARVVLGEAIAQALATNRADSDISFSEKRVGLTYTLLGDPATRLTIGPAQILVTANGQPVVDGQPVRLGTGGDTLRLEAELVSNAQLTGIALERTTPSGTTLVPESEYVLTPPFPDTLTGGRRYHLSYFTTLATNPLRYTLRTTDRWGVTATFAVVFEFQSVLQLAGQPVGEGDPVPPDAALQLLVLSPGTLDPDTQLALEVDGAPQAFTWEPARGDTSGRQFLLSWSHAPYAEGPHEVRLSVSGTLASTHRFTVAGGLRFANLMAFPNPFEDDLGTAFSFTLVGGAAADVLVRVYTASGRLIYERTERSLMPGYHQLAWDARDAEGDKLANGIYFYRIIAKTGSHTAVREGRLVKLRKPHRTEEPAAGP